ncbi:MAG: M20 family metallopeptidase [Planctomycetaceae bacterium]|nr:M20 family metallopeptidase [Planctomycetaceae bacterium]
MLNAVELTKELIAFDSVSDKSNVEVTNFVEEKLLQVGCHVERLEYNDENGVRKASVVGKIGSGTGGMAYFGHTDVVPASNWGIAEHGPFDPHISNGRLYGRGSCDMKGSVACMLAAAARFTGRSLAQPIYITCTADEEVGMKGAEQVAAESVLFKEMAEANVRSIIGEPTSLRVIRGHKGGCSYRLTSRGRAAHSSTGKGVNANWNMIPFLEEMRKLNAEMESDARWQHPEFSPSTMTMNLGINDHTHAINITPPQSVCTVYFRPMPGMDISPLMERIEAAAVANGLEIELRFRSEPLYVEPTSPFVAECLELTNTNESQTVAYGTDGARFGALPRRLVIGPGDIAQAHTHDEWIEVDQLERGTDLYTRMIERWCL